MIKLGFTAAIICSIILFIFLFLVCVMVAMLLLGDSFFKIGRWPALIALIICCVELAVLFDVVPNWHTDD